MNKVTNGDPSKFLSGGIGDNGKDCRVIFHPIKDITNDHFNEGIIEGLKISLVLLKEQLKINPNSKKLQKLAKKLVQTLADYKRI